MKNLKAKLKNSKGFTLIEMLIVVAIIAILIAIAIPMVNRALERAREATDSANERAALGMVMTEVLATNTLDGTTAATGGAKVYYKVTNNKGELTATAPTGTNQDGYNYGKGTAAGAVNSDNAGKCIEITYKAAVGGATGSYEDFEIKWYPTTP